MFLFAFREPVNAWTHLTWLLLALPGTLFLWQRGAGNRARQFTLLIYGLSLVFCFSGSVLFHSARLPRLQLDGLDRLDHIGIYVLIAGSYTPLAWNLLQGRWRWGTLLVTWLATVAGIALVLAFGVLRPTLSTCLYLLMGWGAIFCYIELARGLAHERLRLLVLGGLLYSVGAAINVLKWPVLWPHVLEAHELFHLFVMAGSLAHFWFMLTVVAPSPTVVRLAYVPAQGDRPVQARRLCEPDWGSRTH
jgi:hemolysin III